jgi:tetratricopeptide (TPR) repeat protein
MKPASKPAVLLPGMGKHHHPVATRHPEAQRFFDQGLTFIYAFNHDAAIRAFRRAAEIDPELAMAYWGIALALGPNYNADADPEQLKEALTALRQAQKLAAKAPEPERAYIAAEAKRYADDPKADRKKLAVAYKDAMQELSARYPDDLDAATLYAESAMNLRPWDLWTKDGKPAEGTPDILAVLEGVLRRNPEHPGANHYYIHAIEASPWPERGLPSADRLRTLVPGAGHLVHMPAHIYVRIGDYEQAARQNERAMAADEAYLFRSGATGIYPMMYYSHNIHFLAFARAMQGRSGDALRAAEQLTAHVGPHVKDMAMLEGFMPTPTLVLVKFRRWEEILKLPAPDAKQPIATALHHFARGMALAGTGKIADAGKTRESFTAAVKAIPADAMYGERNKAREVLAVADNTLAAWIALAQNDRKLAVELLRQAVAAEDALNYMEPPDWWLPTRETLGRVLLQAGQHAEAEQTFRAELARHPRNGRSLFGLMECLKAQNKDYESGMVRQQYEAAWQRADVPLKLDEL